ncbi:hypothetical protein HYZ05_02965 [Candidatus Daviesbacteria bacterium]|nr:hypothetical protein [Candidatus Daviesbacteria bacterium]
MEFLVYFKTILFFSVLIICGITILKRVVNETRAQIVIPSGIILGIAFYIFLINAVVHLIKGPPGFYISLIAEIIIAWLIKYNFPVEKINFPKNSSLFLWLISISFWSIFLIIITATSGGSISADSTMHYSLSSSFIRGDYPMHTPWQPDYLAYYHIGVAEFLGASRVLTGGYNNFLYAILSFLVLFSIGQIISNIFLFKENKIYILISSIVIPLIGFISLGGFILAWPINITFPNISEGVVHWLGQLPKTAWGFDHFGAPATIDGFILFIHSLVAVGLFFTLSILIIFPNKTYSLLNVLFIILLLAVIALTDESVLFVILPAVYLISFFTVFNKKVKHFLMFLLISLLLISFQGGIVTETIFSRKDNRNAVLFFPKDQEGPVARFEAYRSYRLKQQQSRLFPDQESYYPFRWLHIGIIWQLMTTFIVTLFVFKKSTLKPERKQLASFLWLLTVSSVFAFVSFHALVPKGWTHINGDRFLVFSHYLSGMVIVFFIFYIWDSLHSKNLILNLFYKIIKVMIIWIVAISIIPQLATIFPREEYSWYTNPYVPKLSEFEWIEKNIPFNDRLLIFVENQPIPATNLQLLREIGALTPGWSPKPRVYYGFDMSPIYNDIYYTLNPKLIEILKLKYLALGQEFSSRLPEIRKKDLQNPYYFQPVYKNPTGNFVIFKILPQYLSEAENLNGTFMQLEEVAPKKGSYYIDYPPNIDERTFRALRLLLHDREIYYNILGAPYNFMIDVPLKYFGEKADHYDFLVLGVNVNPKTICQCKANLIWEGLSNGLRLWQTIKP